MPIKIPKNKDKKFDVMIETIKGEDANYGKGIRLGYNAAIKDIINLNKVEDVGITAKNFCPHCYKPIGKEYLILINTTL